MRVILLMLLLVSCGKGNESRRLYPVDISECKEQLDEYVSEIVISEHRCEYDEVNIDNCEQYNDYSQICLLTGARSTHIDCDDRDIRVESARYEDNDELACRFSI